MLRSFVHDPGLFDSQKGMSELFQVLIATHFESIKTFGVLPLPNNRSALIASLKEFFKTLPPNKRQRFEIVCDEVLTKRTRTVNIPDDVASQVESELQAKDSLTECLSVAAFADPNFTILSDENYRKIAGVSISKIESPNQSKREKPIRFVEYPTEIFPSEYSLHEIDVRGFRNLVLKPVLRWSDDVWLIDRYVNIAYINHVQGDRAKGRNWPKFKNTIQVIFDEWHETSRLRKKEAEFHIITELPELSKTDFKSEDEMARSLHAEISGGRSGLVIHLVHYINDFDRARQDKLKDAPEDRRARVGHGRFLYTSFCTLRFDPGFDLISPEKNSISEGCIVQRSDEASRKIAQTMIAIASQNQVVRWPIKELHTFKQNVADSIGNAFDCMFP